MLSLYTNVAVRLQRNEKGATAVEYGIMVGLIAVVIIVAVTLLGSTLNEMFVQVQCSISGGTFTASAPAVPGVGGVGGSAAVLASCGP